MNPVRNKKINISADLHTSLISNGMKKLSYFFLTVSLLVAIPLYHAAAEVSQQAAIDNTQTYQQLYAKCIEGGGTNAGCTTFATSEMNARAYTPQQILSNQYNTAGTQSQNASTPSGPATGNKLTYIPLEPLPGGNANSYGTLSAYLNLVFKILISIGAMVAVVTLVLGGITYMISEVVDKKSDAKRRIQAALIGLFLLLTCWLILNQINPNLTQFNLVFSNQPNNYNPGDLSTAGNNGQNRLSLPTAAETVACEAPNGVASGKTIHTYEAGSWACL